MPESTRLKVALLTGGKDHHYVRGLVTRLAAKGIDVALGGGREEMPIITDGPGRVVLHDLVGDQNRDAGWRIKVTRTITYYIRLLLFAARADARLFHILWFRKFPQVERILVVLYLKLLGKTVVFTAHNVDDRARDGRPPGVLHGFSLRFLYRRTDHVFVHTHRMKAELVENFGVSTDRVTVLPLGTNDVIPSAAATPAVAREKLRLASDARILLFFGTIAPYKGLEDLIQALSQLVRKDDRFMLAVVGSIRDPSCRQYWRDVERLIVDRGVANHVRKEVRWVPDNEAGLYFKAADVTVLPYRRVYQSGVLGLSYAQGLPVIAADVGAMKDDIIEGETGFVFRSGDADELAATIATYFASDLFKDRDSKAPNIRAHGEKRFSWTENAALTSAVYEHILR
jgi:D-inositol-3-phosphate glycosyltransferase